jgi:predicted RNase H-like nuclease (RuvC/YqgF family)
LSIIVHFQKRKVGLVEKYELPNIIYQKTKKALSMDILMNLLSGIATIIGGFGVNTLLHYHKRSLKKPEKTYSERLEQLTSSLTRSASEVDSLLSELAQVARSKEDTVQKREKEMEALEIREKELKEKIEALEKTPLPVVEHFAKFLESGEKRSAKRDYMLFSANVLATTLIAIIIQIIAG